jgi:DegV family protein with EDD domain
LASEAVTEKIPVRIIDSKAVSMALGLLVLDVAELAQRGATLEQLVEHAEKQLPKVGIIAMLDTLEHLAKGGRVGGARALIGQVLAIKPLLELNNGVVAEAGRQRTRAKALAAISAVARTHTPLRRLAVVHGDSSELKALEALVADIPIEFPLIIADMGPTVGTHGGPGIIGISWLEA